MEEKLQDETTYKQIHEDPTIEIQEKLHEKLKEIHNSKELMLQLIGNSYQIKHKVHKGNCPLREIVDGSGGVTKDINSHIAQIIKPLAESNEFRIKNSQHFVDSIKDLVIADDETLVSYDITALYPSVPQDEAIELIYYKLRM